jgi:hypothetical protein
MVQEMWAKVLALPEQKAARVIRLAVSELDDGALVFWALSAGLARRRLHGGARQV